MKYYVFIDYVEGGRFCFNSLDVINYIIKEMEFEKGDYEVIPFTAAKITDNTIWLYHDNMYSASKIFLTKGLAKGFINEKYDFPWEAYAADEFSLDEIEVKEITNKELNNGTFSYYNLE